MPMWRARHWLCRNCNVSRKEGGGGGGRWMLSVLSCGFSTSSTRKNYTPQLLQDHHSLLPHRKAVLPSLSCLLSYGNRLHVAAASSPHCESVSTIDAALSSLPHLTNSLREFLPLNIVHECGDGSVQRSAEISFLAEDFGIAFEAVAKDSHCTKLEVRPRDKQFDLDFRSTIECNKCDVIDTVSAPVSAPTRVKKKPFYCKKQSSSPHQPDQNVGTNGPTEFSRRQGKKIANHSQPGVSNLESRKFQGGQTKNDYSTRLQITGNSEDVASGRVKHLDANWKQRSLIKAYKSSHVFVQNAGKSELLLDGRVKQLNLNSKQTSYKERKEFTRASVQNAVKTKPEEKDVTNVNMEVAKKDEGTIANKAALADSGHSAHGMEVQKLHGSRGKTTCQPGVSQRVAEFDSNNLDHRKMNLDHRKAKKKQRSKHFPTAGNVEHEARHRTEQPDSHSKQLGHKRRSGEKVREFTCDVVKSVNKADPEITGRTDNDGLHSNNPRPQTLDIERLKKTKADVSMETVKEYTKVRKGKNFSKSLDTFHSNLPGAQCEKQIQMSEYQLALVADVNCITDRVAGFESEKDNLNIFKRTRSEQFQTTDNIKPGVSARNDKSNQNLKQWIHKGPSEGQERELTCNLIQNGAKTELEINDRRNESVSHLESSGSQTLEGNQGPLKMHPSMKAAKENTGYRTLREKQEQIETEASMQAAKEYNEMIMDMCKKQLAPNLPFVKSLLLSWFEPFRDAILAEQRAITENKFSADRCNYGPYLLQLSADVLAVVTMHRLMGMMIKEHEHGSIRLVRAATAVGEAVEQEIEIQRVIKKRKNASKLRLESEASSEPEVQNVAMLEKRIEMMFKHHRTRGLEKVLEKIRICQPWGSVTQAKVGARLIELMTEVAYVRPPLSQMEQGTTEVRQALKHSLKPYEGPRKRQNRMYGVITCDPLVWKSFEKAVHCTETPYMPMLVKPRAWKGYNNGAYLFLRSSLMRTHGARSQKMAVMQTKKTLLKHVFEALDSLGLTAWRINKRVLDIVERIWEEGGRLGGLVDRDDVPVPPKPDSKDDEVLKAWRREAYKPIRTNSERHSLRCDTEIKISVARKFRNEERFFYPHNLDFRGRAYPMHPYLNHLGSDFCRGLLEFAEGRPLGKSGLRWLKIHVANLYANGVDKLSFDGRVAFVDENIDNIIDSANQPLEGDRWWLKAEAPFQCLAACFDLRDALQSKDRENFVSHMPVHQDGSCNGLQHYAALGRDRVGAESVNLTKKDVPADVYSGIAFRVKEMMEMDALKDPTVDKTATSACLLIGQVDRKLVKQTVMTSVYGVTFIGARSQILNRLEERGRSRDNKENLTLSNYAAKTTLTALGEIFNKARSIMLWLADCAKLIASQNKEVRWTTPMGLPVVQAYRKPGWRQVKTSLQVLTLRNDSEQPVLVQRQKTAFPPNFVHSLDSTHMMMTAIACHKAGLCFAGVHDSFWTHAGNVEQMNSILRETFIELYNQPILENLLKSFQEKFPEVNFPPLPERGDFELSEIRYATYFFN